MAEELKYPDYPCVAFLAETRHVKDSQEVMKEEILFFPISGLDDLDHVNQMRKYKKFAVIGYANLDKIIKRAPSKKPEVDKLVSELKELANPPELRKFKEQLSKEPEQPKEQEDKKEKKEK